MKIVSRPGPALDKRETGSNSGCGLPLDLSHPTGSWDFLEKIRIRYVRRHVWEISQSSHSEYLFIRRLTAIRKNQESPEFIG